MAFGMQITPLRRDDIPELRRFLIGGFGVRRVVDHHHISRRRKLQRASPADAAASTSDERNAWCFSHQKTL